PRAGPRRRSAPRGAGLRQGEPAGAGGECRRGRVLRRAGLCGGGEGEYGEAVGVGSCGKQKKGKARAREYGNVSIPQEAFIAALRMGKNSCPIDNADDAVRMELWK